MRELANNLRPKRSAASGASTGAFIDDRQSRSADVSA
jgi:hypothetical protein